MNEFSCPIIEWSIADNIDQVLEWANGMLDDESEVVQIERVSLATILPGAIEEMGTKLDTVTQYVQPNPMQDNMLQKHKG